MRGRGLKYYTNMLKEIKVAIVHDFLNQYGGAERVLEALHEIFPEAPIFTLLYDREKMRGKFEDVDVRVSFLRKFPKFLQKRHKWLLLFFFNDTATTEIYTLSLHDALPI